MEQQNILNKQKGNKEVKVLEPTTVKIVSLNIVEVGDKKYKKVVFSVKHPEKEELLNISSMKQEVKGDLRVVTTWVSLDEDGNLQKGSNLTNLLDFMKVKTLSELEAKDINTTIDSKGYLCLKAY